MKKPSPHDEYFKAAFSEIEIVRDFLEQLVPESLTNALDLDTLSLKSGSFVTPQLKEYFSDVLWSCTSKSKGNLNIALLFEHKSVPERYIHFQLMRYQLEVWEQETQSKKLPSTVIPIVFYHGKKKWKYKPFLHYFKHVDKELQQYLPSFEYIFINLNAIPDEIILQLRIGMLLNTMMVFKHAQDEKYITEQFELIFKDAHWIDDETKRNFLSATLVYLVRCTELSTEKFNEIATPILKEKNSLKMTTYDQFKLEARQEGLQEGRQEGRQEGKIEHAQQVIRAAWEDKFPVATIARLVKLSVEEVEAIIATFEKK